jgi:hypothetical protein
MEEFRVPVRPFSLEGTTDTVGLLSAIFAIALPGKGRGNIKGLLGGTAISFVFSFCQERCPVSLRCPVFYHE